MIPPDILPRVQIAAVPQARSEAWVSFRSKFSDRADQVVFVRRRAHLLAEKFYRIFSRRFARKTEPPVFGALFRAFDAVFSQYLASILPLFLSDRP
jgi:hypothetical protein